MPTKKSTRLALLFILGLVLGPAAGFAQDEAKAREQDELGALFRGRILSSGDMSLEDYIEESAKELDISVILTAEVQTQIRNKKIQIANWRRVADSKADPFEIFRALLKENELTLIPVGPGSCSLYSLVNLRSGAARQRLVPAARLVPASEAHEYAQRTELIRTVVPLQHMDISRVRTELNNLVSQQYGSLNSVQSTNSVIITEFGPVVAHLVRLLREMDQPACQCQGSPDEPESEVRGEPVEKKEPEAQAMEKKKKKKKGKRKKRSRGRSGSKRIF